MTSASTSTSELKDKIVESKVKLLLKTVLERCDRENAQNALVVPLEACEQRASYYTAFPSYCFFELHEKKTIPPPKKYTVREKLVILNAFHKLYTLRKQIKYQQVFDIFRRNLNMTQLPLYLRRELCSMGFEYKITQHGYTIIENPELRYERFHYLNKIMKLRNKNTQICYVEVRVIDKSLEFQKLSLPVAQDGNSKIYYFLYAITKYGYINGIFCNEMDSELFTKWIKDILLTLLAPEAVLVIDSGELFNDKIKPITRYSSKQNMLNWLNSNNIPCTHNMYKPELYELIMKSGIKDCEYKIDHILKAHGYDVLRLPRKFHDLTPTELCWQHMRTKEYPEDLSLFNVKDTIEKHIWNIDQAKWELFSDTIINWEKEIFDVDNQIEQQLDHFKFDTWTNVDFGTSIPEYFFADEDEDVSDTNPVNESNNIVM